MPALMSVGPDKSDVTLRTFESLPRSPEAVPLSGTNAGSPAADVLSEKGVDSRQRLKSTSIETQTFVDGYRAGEAENSVRRDVARAQRQDSSLREDPLITRGSTLDPAILNRARVVNVERSQSEESPGVDIVLQDLMPAERPEGQIIRTIPLEPSAGSISSIGNLRGSQEGFPSVDFSDQPTPTHVKESKVTDQIVRGARFLSREGANQITLRLDPPELGEITIRLSSTGKSLTGEIRVESRMVQDIVNRNLAVLRDSLSGQGIKVDTLQVSVESGSRSGVDSDGSKAFHREDTHPNRQPASDQHSRSEQRDDQQEQQPRQVVQDGNVDFVA